MNNWKCIIGATILTPFAVALFLGILVGGGYVIANFKMVANVIAAMLFLFIMVIFWSALYEHCKEYWAKRRTRRKCSNRF